MKGIIFDLDQTLIDSSTVEALREKRLWSQIYNSLGLISPYPMISEIISYLNKHSIKIAIVTSSPSNYCNKIIKYFGWQVDCIVGFHQTKRRKPYPDPMILASEMLNLNCSELISCGDRAIDIYSSRHAGIKSIGCLWGTLEPRELKNAKPDLLFSKPKELYYFIKQI